MTAEIAILNKHGVALAADSAVSIGTRKVYNSANKLFALSKTHPVGIMIYGNAEFMGTPWETIIKYYRSRRLKNQSFPKLQNYADDFVEFLRTTEIFPASAELRFLSHVLDDLCRAIVDAIKKAVAATTKEKALDSAGVVAIIKDILQKFQAHAETLTQSVLFNEEIRQSMMRAHADTLKDRTKKWIESLPFEEDDYNAVFSIFNSLVGSTDLGNENHSGVVMAGFGDDEIFPHMDSFLIQGRAQGYLKIEHQEPSGSDEGGAVIRPFAQREMVDMFMSGTDPSCVTILTRSFQDILEKLPEIIIEKYGLSGGNANTIASIKEDLDKLGSNLSRNFNRFQEQNFVEPVLSSVGALPLDELASMAESLVNLTSFKRKVTMVQESVGGPIDVAVISKGDGFIWIKRKHYFSSELNHHFFANSQRIYHDGH